jgi:hypothetical protein
VDVTLMGKLYCLFSISSNTLYTTIQGCQPTNDYFVLENLRSYVGMIKPPNGSCTLEILETDESGSLTSGAREMVRMIRERLT